MNLLPVLLQTDPNELVDRRFSVLFNLFSENPAAKQTFFHTLLIFAAIPVVLWIVYKAQQRLQGGPASHPARLLWELAGTAALGWSDRLLLMRLAQHTRLENPAAILLSANCFDRVVADWLRTGRGVRAARLKRIRKRLYGAEALPSAAMERPSEPARQEPRRTSPPRDASR